jgi:hypothetical protein
VYKEKTTHILAYPLNGALETPVMAAIEVLEDTVAVLKVAARACGRGHRPKGQARGRHHTRHLGCTESDESHFVAAPVLRAQLSRVGKSMAASKGILRASNAVLLLCDIQTKFSPHISYFKDIVQASQRLVLIDPAFFFLMCGWVAPFPVSEVWRPSGHKSR